MGAVERTEFFSNIIQAGGGVSGQAKARIGGRYLAADAWYVEP
jgi:hypothetical protein